MKAKIAHHLASLNSFNVESALSIFKDTFDHLSFSFDKPTSDELNKYAKEIDKPTLTTLWLRQKEMKHPGFILYFVMWHFRDKTLNEKGYSRDVSKKGVLSKSGNSKVVIDEINRDLDRLHPLDGAEFLGTLIGNWMLVCPKEIVLDDSDSSGDRQPSQAWIAYVFPTTLGNNMAHDELKLLYSLDHRLYYMFADMEAHNY